MQRNFVEHDLKMPPLVRKLLHGNSLGTVTVTPNVARLVGVFMAKSSHAMFNKVMSKLVQSELQVQHVASIISEYRSERQALIRRERGVYNHSTVLMVTPTGVCLPHTGAMP